MREQQMNRRGLGLVLVLAALAAAGCGGSSKPSTVQFARAGAVVPGHPAPPRLPRHLRPGSMLVLGMTDMAAIMPSSFDFASDGTVTHLRWRGWGTATAVGHGTAVIRVCVPNCGQGHNASYPATFTVTGTAACDGARFYTGSSMVVATSQGDRKLASFVRNPC